MGNQKIKKMINSINLDSLKDAYENKQILFEENNNKIHCTDISLKYSEVFLKYFNGLQELLKNIPNLEHKYSDEIHDALLEMENYENGFFELQTIVKYKFFGLYYNSIFRRYEGFFLIEVENCFGYIKVPLYGDISEYKEKYLFNTKELVL